MTTDNTPLEVLTIPFLGRDMQVTAPNEDQIAVLIAAQEWFRRQRRRLDELEPQLDALGEARKDETHPIVAEAHRLAQEGIRHVGRFQTILKTMFVDPEDWNDIQDGMAERSVRWQDVSDIPALVLEARNAGDAAVPANRAGRRAAAKKTAGRLAR